MKRGEAVLDLYNAALGAFLFVSPWLFAFSYAPARADALLSGSFLVLVSLVAIAAFREWEEWINLAIGCWILASPWVLGFPHSSGVHVATGVGVVVMFLSLLELYLLHDPAWTDRPTAPQRSEPRR